MSKASIGVAALAAAFLLPHGAAAGVYTDELSKCVLESTTEADRTDLVKWMFAAASAHPAVKPLTRVSTEQLREANATMGRLITRLLTETCLETAKKAFQYEGALAFQTSMRLLGQVAGQELFSSPEVAGAMAGLGEGFDQERVQAILEGK
jgi:hypothetical protein